jgi:hypothetical protein
VQVSFFSIAPLILNYLCAVPETASTVQDDVIVVSRLDVNASCPAAINPGLGNPKSLAVLAEHSLIGLSSQDLSETAVQTILFIEVL